jgi:predicted nucleic acid-binding protein
VKYVLDTNVVARLLDNDARVAPRFAAVATDSVGMPLVVLAELLLVSRSPRVASTIELGYNASPQA